MTHSRLVFCALLAPFALLLIEGCGSSTTSTTGSGGSTSSSNAASTSSASTGTGGAGTGGALACQQACAMTHAAGLQAFNGYQFQECGCPADAGAPPCATECTAECMDPTTLMASTPCGMCLQAEKAKGSMSSCTLQAAILNPNDCQSNQDCAKFLTCEQACPK